MNSTKINKLKIVFEDEELIVLNKDAGIITHSDISVNEYSLVDLLKENNITLSKGENIYRPGVVHRLDRETSGIIVFAKTDKAFTSLKKQFFLREVEKVYHALVWGVPSPIAGKINIPITSYLGKKKISFSQNSKEAITLYKTINTYQNKFSLIECKILTGRTHQIRVHLLSKGCPLIGDKVYARGRNMKENTNKNIVNCITNYSRQALHALKITFLHPIDNNILKFNADKPEDFLRLEEVLFED